MVAGGDETLYQEMQNTTWHVPATIYNFTKELPVMMLASDIVVTKAGGLITSESLAASLPMILIDVLPGQEEGNALYIQENNAGVHAKKPIDILHIANAWFENDGYELRKFTENARKIGKPRSSLDIADLIVENFRINRRKKEKEFILDFRVGFFFFRFF
jgi:1,2-diacylglycerol 3-beta-galactosyltransferase